MTIDQLKNIKTFSALCNILKLSNQIDIRELNYNSLFNVTIGSHKSNIFIQIDMVNKMFAACERVHNGKNYDIKNECKNYVTNRGWREITQFLGSRFN